MNKSELTNLCGGFNGRIGIAQVVLPKYRESLYEEIALKSEGGLHVFYGTSVDKHSVQTSSIPNVHLTRTKNRTLLGGRFTLYWQDEVVDWLEKTQPDVLIIECNPRMLSTHKALKWMHERNRPVLGWGLGTLMLASGFESIRTIGRKKFLSKFDGIICYGSRAKKEYAALGLNKDNLFVAYNAVSRKPIAKPLAKSYNNWVPHLLFVGRINEGKRVDRLIEAVCRIRNQKRIKLTIVGNGDEKLLNRLSEQGKSLGADLMLSPSLFGEQLVEKYQEADIFVLPGLGGLAIQEAMCHGLPVIAAESDGTQDDLISTDNGWALEVYDVKSLANIILEAVSDPSKLEKMGKCSYERAESMFNVEEAAGQMLGAVSAIYNSSRNDANQ